VTVEGVEQAARMLPLARMARNAKIVLDMSAS
jgi:hypothetical protein